MADTTALKNRIRAAIKSNDNQEITGPVLQQALLDMVDELNGATETEASQRQSGDSTLQQGINTERQRAQEAEGNLGQRITQETQRAQEAEQIIDGKASKALHDINNLEIEDVTGSQTQANELSIALRTNEGSEQDPEIVTLDTLIMPSATNQKAGLMSASDKISTELCAIVPLEIQERKYIDAEGQIKTDQNFDLYVFDIESSTHAKMYFATGGGRAVIKNSNNEVLEAFRSIPVGASYYENTWLFKEFPQNSYRLYVTQARHTIAHPLAFPAIVKVNNKAAAGTVIDKEVVENSPNAVSSGAVKNAIDEEKQRAENSFEDLILEDVTGSQAQTTEMSVALNKNNGTEQEPEIVNLSTLRILSATDQKAGLMSANDKISLTMFDVNYVQRFDKKYIDDSGVLQDNTNFDVYVYDLMSSKYALMYFATGGGYAVIKNSNNEVLEAFRSIPVGNDYYVNTWLFKQLPAEANRLYVTQSRHTNLHERSLQIAVKLDNNTNIEYDKEFDGLYMEAASDDVKVILRLLKSDRADVNANIRQLSTLNFLSATSQKAGLLSANDKFFLDSLQEGEIKQYEYGLQGTSNHQVTKGQIYGTGYPVNKTGNIVSLTLDVENITNETIVIGIANYNSENDTLIVESSQDVTLSSGENVLATPIPVRRGQYICYLQKSSSSLNKFLPWDNVSGTNVGCFSDSAYNSNTIPAGKVLTRGSMNIHFNPSITIEYSENIQEKVQSLSERLTSDEEEYSQDIEDLYNKILNLENKKVVFIGDSITDSHGDGGQYAKKFIQKTGCIGFNRGWSGSTVATGYNSMCDRLDLPADDGQALSDNYLGFPTTADLVFLYGGINDWGRLRSQVFGSLLDPPTKETFCGALKYMMIGLKNRYPTSNIVIINLHHVYSTTSFTGFRELSYQDDDETKQITIATNDAGKTLYDYRKAIKDCADMYGLPVIDMFNVGFSAILDTDQRYYKDGLHPSELGGEVMANYMINQLKYILSK